MSRGLTLVELVITISLAAILGIPVGLLLSEHLTSALGARDVTVATNLARREMEYVDSLNDNASGPFFSSALGGAVVPTTTDFLSYQGYPYTLRRTVTCLLGNCTSTSLSSQGVKRITVTVYKPSATDPFAQLLATLITYRTKHVAFGS